LPLLLPPPKPPKVGTDGAAAAAPVPAPLPPNLNDEAEAEEEPAAAAAAAAACCCEEAGAPNDKEVGTGTAAPLTPVKAMPGVLSSRLFRPAGAEGLGGGFFRVGRAGATEVLEAGGLEQNENLEDGAEGVSVLDWGWN
jgi:hypothetical protein